ncbi:hypothetical protein RND81_10G117200 [Saponaria officinalis]|uniref:Uncharacterized protein n=1 Tax=Saponaria officinalis TaxID=3572 RepID=A0AAW1I3I7_SAPOF
MGGLMGWVVEEQGWRKGPWTPEEDKLLSQYVTLHGEGRWSSVSRCAGLNRSGKSCRLRWVNYLRPGLKRGQITPQEEGIIIELHALWGNKWSTIARYLPGRTDNEIKNYWRTHFKKKERSTRKSSERRKSSHTTKIKPKQQQEEVELPPIITSSSEQINNQVILNNNNNINNKQDLTFIDPNTTIDDQNLIISTPSSTAWMDDSLFWGGLWNFGEQLAMNNQDQLCSKMAISLQNQATTNINTNNNINNNIINVNNNGLFWGEDSNNFYRGSDQGFIF